jgi:hypothetical protein
MYEYSAQDVHPLPATGTTERSRSKPRNVVCIELQCGVGNCASLLRIRTLMAADIEPRDRAPEVVALGVAHAIPCDKGHIQSGLPKDGLAFSAAIDSDWEQAEN